MRSVRVLIPLSLILALMVGACNFPFPGRTIEPTDSVLTIAARTVNAQLTAGGVNTATPKSAMTSTPLPTATPFSLPTATPRPYYPSPVPVYVPCDRADFIDDVTVNDGTKFNPNQAFTKTWRLRNSGTCTWTTAYALVFDTGDAMSGPVAVGIPGAVAPGQYIDISVNLKAPGGPGKYRGYWRLRNSTGASFGIGPNANVSFWVEIEVVNITATPTTTATSPATVTIYDFANNYCAATWMSDAGTLPCPGTTSDSAGFVVRSDNPTLQDGLVLNGRALWTHPEWVTNGVISGRYPPIVIQSGDHFKARIGCLTGSPPCNVIFQLNYRANGGSLQNLGTWGMTYTDSPRNLDLDLSSFAGQSVEFSLAVTANGEPNSDWAIWFNPLVVQ